MRPTFARLAALLPLLAPWSLGGCQAVVDFDEARICADSQLRPLDCSDPSLAPEGTVFACVLPTCDRERGACAYPPNTAANGTACDDPDPCTIDTVCQDGECTGDIAPDGTQCDFNPCRPGFCEAGTCVTELLPEGSPCDDGDECSIDSVCQRVVTPDGTVLTNCNGVEDPDRDGTPCDDGNLCTMGTVCFLGACTGNPVCNVGEACDAGDGTCSCGDGGAACQPGEVCDADLGACSCLGGSPCAVGEVCRRGTGCQPA